LSLTVINWLPLTQFDTRHLSDYIRAIGTLNEFHF